MFENKPDNSLDIATASFAGFLSLVGIAALIFAALLLFLPSTAKAATEGSDAALAEGASASLPLNDVLELYRERDRARQQLEDAETPENPPVDGVVDRLELHGRLLDDALEIRAQVQITVLAENRWVRLPLLRLSSSTVLGELPATLKGTALMIENQELVALVKRAPGSTATLSFNVSLIERASSNGELRTAYLRPAKATLQRLTLELDEALFRLEADAQRQGERYRLFPDEGIFKLSWRRHQPKLKDAEAHRPPLEPVISAAHLSTVSTLEGEVHHRLRYDLLFEGSRQLDITVPAEVSLEKVFVNGRSIPFELENRILTLTAQPARAGDRHGRVELSLRPNREAYHLSGQIFLTLPSASWPVNHLFARLHLPAVFDYRWSGGSLSPAEQIPSPEFTEKLPTPGDELAFHQPLVQGSQPTVRVAYDIDLEGQIFGAH